MEYASRDDVSHLDSEPPAMSRTPLFYNSNFKEMLTMNQPMQSIHLNYLMIRYENNLAPERR
jgi:hypothetical protein